MAIRPSRSSTSSQRRLRRLRDQLQRRQARRDLRLETLEDRRLMAGLDLAGIATNQTTLLQDGAVYNESPRELTLRFNDGAILDEASLASGIEIIRSGGDGTFQSASVRSDMNTGGAVIMEFSAVLAGSAGDGIRLDFSKNNRGPTGGVGIEVNGSTIKIDLNTNVSDRTTAAALRTAINSHALASQLIRATVLRGSSLTDVAAPAINYSPLTLTGANNARGTSNFQLGQGLEIEFTAVASGVAGNGIQINFSKANFGGAGAPRITVNGRTINVQLNSTPGSETTAAALVTTLNSDLAAGKLISARQTVGAGSAVLTASSQAILPVTLIGSSDVVLTAGFVGYGESKNVAVFRFAETLVDDVYRVNVLGRPGGGRTPVRETSGDAFRNGASNYAVSFELDLGAQVLSVVPQPVVRRADGSLEQLRNVVHVYFNDDDLNRALAENPNFYELIRVQDTARNTDDVSFRPTSVVYDAAADRAVLTFDPSVMNSAGTFRLRLGTDEAIPLAPATLTPGIDVGSSFTTALDLSGSFETGAILSVRGNGTQFVDGQTFTITDSAGVTWTFEFEKTTPVPPPTAGRTQIVISNGMTATAIAQAITSAVNSVASPLSATAAGSTVRLANDVRVHLSADIRGLSKSSQGLIVSGSVTNDGQPYTLQFPGDIGEPGHRDIILPAQNHYLRTGDIENGITRAFYNFQTEYGFDPQGNVLRNGITETQMQRVREIFDLYGNYFGIQFVESAASGMTIAVGDMRALNPLVDTGPGGVLSIAGGGLTGRAVLDLADFDDQNDEFGGEFFQAAMSAIGRLLGLGDAYEQPQITMLGNVPVLVNTSGPEPVFPGDSDIVHGRNLYRPESKDIDLYRFDVTQRGLFSAETFAERLANASQLDTVLTLYRETANGRELVARNDNYFSNDSFLELQLEPGIYYIGISAAGNEDYDPTIADSGLGGTTEGDYQLRLNFRGESTNAIVDVDNANNPLAGPVSAATALDGDADGKPGGVFNFWFKSQTPANTIFVDKSAPAAGATGDITRPYRDIDTALLNAQPGDIVRIVGNGGADRDITTTADNLAYEIGFSALGGAVLADGSDLQVPQGVTVMIDQGALLKFRRSYVGVGSLSLTADDSAGALQVLGVPRVIDANGQVRRDSFGQAIPGNVIFTSLHERIGVGTNPQTNPPAAAAGDWGGIIFRSDLDNADDSRLNYEDEGIFLNSVYQADMRFGGGQVVVQGRPTVVDPIYIEDVRPTVAYTTITGSLHAAISANPNSFLETNFHAPEYQVSGAFTSDYTRIGPDISGVRATGNTINGLFVRMRTDPTQPTESLTVAGRWDDTDIVHVLQENLNVAGSPGGLVLEDIAPPVTLVTVAPGPVGGTLVPGTYSYRITFIDANGNEGPASDVTGSVTIPGNPDVFNQQNVGTVRLANLPTVGQFPGYVARRIYRSTPGGTGPYTLVRQINGFDTQFLDNGATAGGELDPAGAVLRARTDARLRIDAGAIIKSEAALIDVGRDATLIAEGSSTDRIIMTSLADRRYGAGGTFSTSGTNGNGAQAGEWGGIYAGHLSDISIDNAVIAFGGGTARVDGAFRSFNALEIHQAEARVANSIFEGNATGFDEETNSGDASDRFGRGFNASGTIFIRGAQPVIVENIFRDNLGAVINVNVNALNGDLVADRGRATGRAEVYQGEFGNFGPLVSGNLIDDNGISGMIVRGGILTTESVWDDTDIVHVVLDTVTVPNFHTYGGLRLSSKTTESLVVKLLGDEAGFTATGSPLDIDDRIGGAVHILGQPGFPVILTSMSDDSVGAGFRSDGRAQTDTDNAVIVDDGGLPTGPEVDRGNLIDNDVDPNTTGFFSYRAGDAGNASFGSGAGVTVDGPTGQLVNQDFIFDHLNFVDVGGMGQGINLASTNITMPATLVSDDLVVSEGNFTGENGTVQWRVESFFDDGIAKLVNRVTFTSSQGLGNLRLINYLDEDVGFFEDDLLYLQGTPGQPDFRAFTLDNSLRVGFSHGGVYVPGPELVGATFEGWAADEYSQLLTAIQGNGTNYTVDGNIDTADIPPFNDPELGQVFGLEDVTTAFSWRVDPGVQSATITSFLELIPTNPATTIEGQAGDWRSIRFESYTHDRNVDVLNELEPATAVQPGSNSTPNSSEFLGELAADEKSGDDNARLGFTVHGSLSQRQDVDVYRFAGRAGSEVWLDIDRTNYALDTVIELIGADGRVLARSDNSAAEALNPNLIFKGTGVTANRLQKSAFDGVDRYSTNPRDAGLRVVLPGSKGVLGNYYVRVRSSSDNLTDLSAGQTKGSYQLQVRLREVDEVAGTTVRYSDIRYATNGIEILGQPIHSPLAGEVGESTADNNAQSGAQGIGNLMNTDRSTLGIAGRLTTGNDIDFYQFEAIYTDVNPAVLSVPRHVPVVFDMDYADGLGRPNTMLSIYDANGNLVLVANNSNVSDDQPGPLLGSNMDDLARGSAGVLDPFLGSVVLPVGSYYATVSSVAQIPAEMGQHTLAAPVNPRLRLEPVNSVRRIAEDHLGGNVFSTADAPVVPVLFNSSSVVPWTLGDITLYVSQDPGTVDQTNLHTVNPFTGQRTTQVGRFNFDIGDLALRRNGNLMSYTLDLENFPTSDAEAGRYLLIDTGLGTATAIGSSGIQTFEEDLANPGTAIRSNPVGNDRIGDGIHFQAITFGHLGDFLERGWAIGSRPPFANPPGINATRNILYEFVPDTGTAISAPVADRTGNERLFGAGTQIVERGRLLTDADPLGTGSTVLLTPEATAVGSDLVTTPIILDGTRFAVDDGATTTQFAFVSGPEVRLNLAPGLSPNPIFIRDGDTFFLDGEAFEFDTGEVLLVTAANGNFITDGDRFTITDNQTVPVTRIFEWDNGSGPTPPGNVIPVSFNVGMNRQQLTNAVVAAINAQTQFDVNGNPIFAASAQALPTADNNFNFRISLLNSSAASETSGGMDVTGNSGLSTSRAVPNPPGTHLIRIEEVYNNQQVGEAVELTFNGTVGPPATPGVPGIEAGADGNRLNFMGADLGDFSEIIARGAFTDLGHDSTAPAGSIAVPFLADDTADQIAQRITEAINDAGLTATSNGPVVTLADGAIFDEAGTDDPPLTIAGSAPGGEITGMAFLGGQVWAVSDAGGLFRIVSPSSPGGAFADYIETSTDLLGIDFQGLSAGPQNAEGGRFANMLFGIDTNGRMYAFNTAGELQPVFVNGATSIDTGVTNANGLAFSTLDVNLWHNTDSRGAEAGHGINEAFDGSRIARNGDNSLWFGWESQARNGVPVNPFTNPVNNSADYNFPGGAHGAVISNEFSLEGYSAEDLPVLYFNYRLATENASATLNPNPEFMRDSFRVYAAGEDGEWHLLATNNSGRRAGGANDEYDDFNLADDIDVEVQELFDVGDNAAPDAWRQARVSLAPFAGQSGLKLRFEFSSAGEIDFGDPNSTGSFLEAVLGRELRDGQRVLIDGDTFEFDLGYSLVAPSGANLTDGETLTIHGRTFEFDSNGSVGNGRIAIPFNAGQSASAVASEIRRVLEATNFTRSINLIGETGNDTLATAVNSGLLGGSDRLLMNGVIGDNPNLAATPGLDVDLVRLNLNAGDRLVTTVTAAAASGFNPLIRLFDAAGNQIAINDDSNGVNPRFDFTIAATGTYYLGISGSPNSTYSPATAGSGVAGSTGAYTAEIQINGFTGLNARLHDNRIQLENATKVAVSAGAALVIDGAAGVPSGNVAIPVHADMTEAQVAAAVQQALANRYAGGVLNAFKVERTRVQVVGHTVAAPGPLGLSNSLVGDRFGSWETSTRFDGGRDANNPGALRAQNNDHEGVYIDDIIIGFAERGEMVTGAAADTSFINNPALPDFQVLEGDYQLEIRQGTQYAVDDILPVPTRFLTRSFDTNDRQTQGFTLTAPRASDVVDGQTFQLSDGVNTVTFEFEDVNIGNGVAAGRIPIPFDPSAAESGGGIGAESDIVLARRIRDAINSTPVQNVLKLRAGLSDGKASGSQSTDIQIQLYGNALIGSLNPVTVNGDLTDAASGNDTAPFAVNAAVPAGVSAQYLATGFIGDNPALTGLNAPLDVDLVRFQLTAGTRMRIDIDASTNNSTLDAMLRLFDVSGNQLAFSDDAAEPNQPFTLDPYIEFLVPVTGTYYVGVSSFNNRDYDINSPGSASGGFSIGPYTLDVQLTSGGIAAIQQDDLGDINTFRDQGQLLIQANRISNTAEFGINIDAGARDGAGDNPHQGPPRVTREVNAQRLVPGVVVENNLIYGNADGGIRYSGSANATDAQVGSVPFGRIINNTLYGTGAGDVGLSVENNASPTLLNNIVANFGLGVSVDDSSSTTVVGGTLYKDNAENSSGGLGTFPLVLAPEAPLFVNATEGNFYLRANSPAIDSGVNSVSDRQAMRSVRNPLGYAESPIIAPGSDLLGQLRLDDPTFEPPPGAGQNPFIDRGAIDRADTAGPTAVVIHPRDNDTLFVDSDRRVSFLRLANEPLAAFAIQLRDGVEPIDPANGSGIDDTSVSSAQVRIFRDDVLLKEGIDYRFNYDAVNNIIRLTPIAGLWAPDHTYLIRLANRDQFVLAAPAGDQVVDGETVRITDNSGNAVTFEFESGYTLTVPETLSLLMPDTGGGLGGVTDRESFTVSDGTRTVTFEFDNNGSTASGSRPIVFTPQSSAEDLAAAVVQALTAANLGLAPRHLGNGRVHVGALPNHVVNLANAPSLSRAGSSQGGVVDGGTFTLDDGVRRMTFEFERTGGVRGGNIPITFTQSDTYENIANRIVSVVEANAPGLDLTHLGQGVVHFGGGPLTVLNTTGSGLTQSGLPGVASEFGIQIPSVAGVPQGIVDGRTFRIGNGTGLPVTFEIDTNGVAVPGNTVVRIAQNAGLNAIANAIAQAINSVGLGLSPVNAGGGRIILNGDTASHFFQPQNSGLVQLGTPGVAGSVAVNFLPDDSFTAETMAARLVALINANSVLVGVEATQRGNEVVLEGAANVEGAVGVFVGGIRDLAGNILQPNRDTTTEFVIQLGSGFDYGDAPQSLGYPTTEAANGPRHVVVPGFSLGTGVDIEVNGLPTTGADGDDLDVSDDEDGVTFVSVVRGYVATATITASGITPSQPGFVDAWIDFNGDGDWDDAGEQIATSLALNPSLDPSVATSQTQLNFEIPETANLGTTYARFRLSSTGGLSPTGLAVDGEVEDYRLTIGSSSWHNGALPNDVNGDGRVNSFDVLVVLSFLLRAGTGSGGIDLPDPPPLIVNGSELYPDGQMIDVTGDGRASIADVRAVLVSILTGGGSGEAAEGEALAEDSAEGEGEAVLAASLQRATTIEMVAAPLSSSTTASSTTADRPAAQRSKSAVREVVFQVAPAADSAIDFSTDDEYAAAPLLDVADELAADQQGDLLADADAFDQIFAELGN